MGNLVRKNNKLQEYDMALPNTRDRLSRLYEHYQLESCPNQGDEFETLLTNQIGGFGV
jgi:hypothetical protein